MKDPRRYTTSLSQSGLPAGIQRAKEAAGIEAVKYIQSGMLVGIGTGSTVAFFLQALGRECKKGLQITGVPSSKQTQELAERCGIPLIDMNEVAFFDITVDGADEIDGQMNMIKGGGGALLREKIIASASREMVVIVDEAKCVQKLGKHPLPVEVVAFGSTATLARLDRMGYRGQLRRDAQNEVYITDNSNLIFDMDVDGLTQKPQEIDRSLRAVVGVVETGFFFDLADRVIIGFADGHVQVRG